MKRPVYLCKICHQRIYGKYQCKDKRYYVCPDCRMVYVVQDRQITHGYQQKSIINYT